MSSGPRERVVIVAGASRGLGRRVAEACARKGWRTALLARSTVDLQAVSDGIRRAGGTAGVWPVDIRDEAAVRQAVEDVWTTWGRIDALINVAGMKVEGRIETTPSSQALEALRVNYLGPLALCQAVLPRMRRQGHGHVINVSSVLGKRATPLRGAYAASKSALNALTDALRSEVAPAGIRVTLVCPGRLAAGAGGLLTISERRAAERIVRCLQRPRRELVLSAAGRLLAGLNALLPGLVDRVLARWRVRA